MSTPAAREIVDLARRLERLMQRRRKQRAVLDALDGDIRTVRMALHAAMGAPYVPELPGDELAMPPTTGDDGTRDAAR